MIMMRTFFKSYLLGLVILGFLSLGILGQVTYSGSKDDESIKTREKKTGTRPQSKSQKESEESSDVQPAEALGESTSFRSTSIAIPVATEAEVAVDLTAVPQKIPSKRTHTKEVAQQKGDAEESSSDQALALPEVADSNQRDRSPASGSRRARRPSSTGKMDYEVLRGDTLMKIAFKAYADPLRWREIFEDNRAKIKDPRLLSKGIIVLLRTSEFAIILKNGVAYLIKRKDTLSKIAREVYGDQTKWPKIWKNNPELIKDPNKIYAGFTLYYPKIDKQ